jgi:hypothetical protein
MSMRRSRRRALAVAGWLLVSFCVWNGFFDILVSRGEKQYLLAQARHELGAGPKVTMDEVMSRTIHDGVRTASLWAAFVFAGGLGVTALFAATASERRPASGMQGQDGSR